MSFSRETYDSFLQFFPTDDLSIPTAIDSLFTAIKNAKHAGIKDETISRMIIEFIKDRNYNNLESLRSLRTAVFSLPVKVPTQNDIGLVDNVKQMVSGHLNSPEAEFLKGVQNDFDTPGALKTLRHKHDSIATDMWTIQSNIESLQFQIQEQQRLMNYNKSMLETTRIFIKYHRDNERENNDISAFLNGILTDKISFIDSSINPFR
jgi:hypothetical protein